jgi:hypothetical protein
VIIAYDIKGILEGDYVTIKCKNVEEAIIKN